MTKVTLPGGATNEFAYDGDKRRISKTNAAGEVTKFLYDGINILEDYAADGAVLAYYVQGIGIDKLIKRVTPAGCEYYHSDALGSVRALTDKDGNQVGSYQYDAWGKITGSTGQSSNEYKFTSRRWDEEIGLQYNRARFYDPETGRFTTPDPLTGGPDDPTISYFSGIYSIFHRFIKEHVDALQPNKLNRYVYCYNNPVNLIDPLGLQAEEQEEVDGVQIKANEEENEEKKNETAGQQVGPQQPGQTANDVAEEEEVTMPKETGEDIVENQDTNDGAEKLQNAQIDVDNLSDENISHSNQASSDTNIWQVAQKIMQHEMNIAEQFVDRSLSEMVRAWNAHQAFHNSIREAARNSQTGFGYEYSAAAEVVSLGGLMLYGASTAAVEGGTSVIPAVGWGVVGVEVIWVGVDIFQGIGDARNEQKLYR